MGKLIFASLLLFGLAFIFSPIAPLKIIFSVFGVICIIAGVMTLTNEEDYY